MYRAATVRERTVWKEHLTSLFAFQSVRSLTVAALNSFDILTRTSDCTRKNKARTLIQAGAGGALKTRGSKAQGASPGNLSDHDISPARAAPAASPQEIG
jgi:hypothetical protein